MIESYKFTATDKVLYRTIKNRIYIDTDTSMEYRVIGLTKINNVTHVILEDIMHSGMYHILGSHDLSKLQYTIK